MRSVVLFASVLAVLAVSPALGAAPEMPYTAYISSDDVYVRSGPGKNYYPTGKLSEGTAVEVYRHDPGGWYAIRPPKESFAWVSARYLDVGADRMATVIGDQVAARVGSVFSDIRDVIQVRLHEGEVVEILGEKQFSGTSESSKWYKISPPSGEFRWVSGRFVDAEYMTSGIRNASSNASPLVAPSAARPTLVGSAEEPGRLSDPRDRPETAEEQFAMEEPGLFPEADEPFLRPLAKPAEAAGRTAHWVAADGVLPASDSQLQPAQAEWAAASAEDVGGQTVAAGAMRPLGYVSPRIPELNETEEPKATPILAPVRSTPVPFDEALDQLELQLSRMLAEEPTVWSFSELEIQAQSLLERTQTALERGKVRLVLTKIARSADIKNRYSQFVDTEVQLDRREQQYGAAESVAEPQAAADADAEELAAKRFDGLGRLARVVTSDVGAPQYALVDSEGKVACYVTPAPGVNLRYYLGSRIGIHGTGGYLSQRQARHVTARHVTPLDPQVR